MTPDQIADRIVDFATEYKTRSDAQLYRTEATKGRDLGICLGLKTGADKLRQALSYTSDFELIADETERFAAAYMAMLKEPETLTDKELAYHLGIKRGLDTVARLTRSGLSYVGPFTPSLDL